MDYGAGRIHEIICAIKDNYKVASVSSLSTKVRLNCLCESLRLSTRQFDNLIANNSAVLRTIKGHVFELVFDHLLTANGYESAEVGGDKGFNIGLMLGN